MFKLLMSKNLNRVGALIIFAVLCVVFIGTQNKNSDDAIVEEGNLVSIANPASVNCADVGGTTTIETKEDGSQYGLCYFDDNRACEEWAMFRGECPVGGMKTTGYDTIDQKFCAWSGGSTIAVENSICVFKDGTSCPTIDFYNGNCTESL